MKTKIIIMTIASICLLMLTPSIHAVEQQTVQQSIMEKISAEHSEIIQTVKDKLENIEGDITINTIIKIILMIVSSLVCIALTIFQILFTIWYIYYVFTYGDPCSHKII